ncbi:MAG: cobalamin B12-binding domain-containing protein, partial [Thermoplasmata archaeon]|nr:cobalamin B12-binding domain-containing protein [Thermoplasmata archaeon]
MKVILINPPSLFLNIPNAYPPTGLMYLGAALESRGIEVSIVDLCDDKDWAGTVGRLDGDVFGVTSVTPNYKSAGKIIEMLPEDSVKMIGGAHSSALPNETFEDLNCHVLTGEGEDIIAEMINGGKPRIWEGGLVDVNKYSLPA